MVARRQLLGLGLTRHAIVHRIERGRLHPLWRGVYAVGRPDVGRRGRWMGAVLACGPDALLAGRSAAALLGLFDAADGIDVVVPPGVSRRLRGIRVCRRSGIAPADRTEVDRIPATGAALTLLELAASRVPWLEQAIGAADRANLIDPESLRANALSRSPNAPGRRRLLEALDRHTLTPTDSVLERWFLAIVAEAGLPMPVTQAEVNGYRVDFYWPAHGLVVETDGLRYHRTAAQQARDLRRDQAHTAAGLRTLRFPAAQVRHDPASVRRTLHHTLHPES